MREIAEARGVTSGYQLEQLTGFSPDTAASLWRNEWKAIYLKTLNVLCNLFECTPNDLLVFEPDKDFINELKKTDYSG